MLDSYKVLGAMLALESFSAADLAQFSKVDIETVRNVIRGREYLLERASQQSEAGRGGRFVEYRLRPDKVAELRKSIRRAFNSACIEDPPPTREAGVQKLPLNLLAAEDLLIWEHPGTRSLEERRLLEIIHTELEASYKELRALSPDESNPAVIRLLRHLEPLLWNNLQEAIDSTAITIGGRPRGFNVIVIGGGTFRAMIASSLFLNDETHSLRIRVLDSGPFVLPEHVQNMPFPGGSPDPRVPWDSHPALEYTGLYYAIGGRSLVWGGWSPEMLNQELRNWPSSVVAALKDSYFRQSSDQIGASDSNDFNYCRLHLALRRQLFDGVSTLGNARHAINLAALPDHPAVRYAVSLAAAVVSLGRGTMIATTTGITDAQLRELLGLRPTDTTPRSEMLNLMKLEAPLAMQARGESRLFPFNKFSTVPELIKVARMSVDEIGGVGSEADARKRLMIVPKVRFLDIITETQADNWVRVTGVRVKDTDGLEKVIPVAPPSNGRQSAVVIALGTIESTRLAINTFKDSLSWRAAQRMGKNLITHLRSNLTIRIPKTSLISLPLPAQTSLQASALFVKGKANIAGEDRFFHLQITASGLNKLGQDSETELFKKIPDTEQLDTMLRADDSHVVIALRGIGEMTPQNPDSFIRLSLTKTENFRSIAEVTLADVKTGTSNTAQSNIDKKTWDAMDNLADEIALIFANGKPFELLITEEGN